MSFETGMLPGKEAFDTKIKKFINLKIIYFCISNLPV